MTLGKGESRGGRINGGSIGWTDPPQTSDNPHTDLRGELFVVPPVRYPRLDAPIRARVPGAGQELVLTVDILWCWGLLFLIVVEFCLMFFEQHKRLFSKSEDNDRINAQKL